MFTFTFPGRIVPLVADMTALPDRNICIGYSEVISPLVITIEPESETVILNSFALSFISCNVPEDMISFPLPLMTMSPFTWNTTPAMVVVFVPEIVSAPLTTDNVVKTTVLVSDLCTMSGKW